MPQLWTRPDKLLLASTSATRLKLLMNAGLAVETQRPDVDERALEREAQGHNLDPLSLARRLAAAKAMSVSRRAPMRVVLGADQVLEGPNGLLHKPESRAEALRQLESLAGRRHSLHAAGAIAIGGVIVADFVESAHLTMRPLPPEGLTRYLDLAGPSVLQSVGGYQVEGLGIHLFEKVEGEHSTILGLPLLPLLAALRRLGCLSF